MNLKLLFAGLVFSAITANAQVATINENFNNFTSGTTSFPQNGWSAVLATNPLPMPPPPRMIVTTDTNKAIQAYSGNNSSDPSYLISPQIIAPAGDKSVSFTATPMAPYTSLATVQVGVASNPADMATFVAVGSPITITAIGTIQNINVPIPASTGSYLVIKFLPTTAHTAIQIDDFVYNTTASLGTSDVLKSKEDVQFAVNSDNTALQFFGKAEIKNIDVYSAAGQNVASGKVNNNSFSINTLQTGVYYVLIETKDGKAVKSKFIKK
jgi:hypothetical protein